MKTDMMPKRQPQSEQQYKAIPQSLFPDACPISWTWKRRISDKQEAPTPPKNSCGDEESKRHLLVWRNLAQVIGWDRGPPPQTAPKVAFFDAFFALRAHCAWNAVGPSHHLNGPEQYSFHRRSTN